MWAIVYCSLRSVTLDNTKKNRPNFFVAKKTVFFEIFVSMDLLCPKEERNDLITCTKTVKNTYGPFEIRSLRCITLDNSIIRRRMEQNLLSPRSCFFFENLVLDILCPEEIIK